MHRHQREVQGLALLVSFYTLAGSPAILLAAFMESSVFLVVPRHLFLPMQAQMQKWLGL